VATHTCTLSIRDACCVTIPVSYHHRDDSPEDVVTAVGRNLLRFRANRAKTHPRRRRRRSPGSLAFLDILSRWTFLPLPPPSHPPFIPLVMPAEPFSTLFSPSRAPTFPCCYLIVRTFPSPFVNAHVSVTTVNFRDSRIIIRIAILPNIYGRKLLLFYVKSVGL